MGLVLATDALTTAALRESTGGFVAGGFRAGRWLQMALKH